MTTRQRDERLAILEAHGLTLEGLAYGEEDRPALAALLAEHGLTIPDIPATGEELANLTEELAAWEISTRDLTITPLLARTLHAEAGRLSTSHDPAERTTAAFWARLRPEDYLAFALEDSPHGNRMPLHMALTGVWRRLSAQLRAMHEPPDLAAVEREEKPEPVHITNVGLVHSLWYEGTIYEQCGGLAAIYAAAPLGLAPAVVRTAAKGALRSALDATYGAPRFDRVRFRGSQDTAEPSALTDSLWRDATALGIADAITARLAPAGCAGIAVDLLPVTGEPTRVGAETVEIDELLTDAFPPGEDRTLLELLALRLLVRAHDRPVPFPDVALGQLVPRSGAN